MSSMNDNFDVNAALAELIEGVDVYQLRALDTAQFPGHGTGSLQAMAYLALGLNGEAGEAAEIIKKALRKEVQLTADQKMLLAKEVGDVLWYAAVLLSEIEVSLSQAMILNLEKLRNRNQAGQIKALTGERKDDQ